MKRKKVTFEQMVRALKKRRRKWTTNEYGEIRTTHRILGEQCPLAAYFGVSMEVGGYFRRAKAAGLPVRDIIDASDISVDYLTSTPKYFRQALLELVRS